MINVGSKNVYDIKYGNTQIVQVFYGTQLVWTRMPVGTVLFDSTAPGTYSIEIKTPGIYEIIAVGGGGGSAGSGGGGKRDTGEPDPSYPISGG